MAISYVASTGIIQSNTSVTVNVAGVTGITTGDIVIMMCGSAQAQNAVPTINDPAWTYLGTAASTFDTFATTTGPRSLSFWYRVYTTGDANPTITQTGGTGATIGAIGLVYRKASTETWSVSLALFAEDATSATSVSATTTGTMSVTAGDRIAACFVSPKNATHTAEAIAITGATMAAATERLEGSSAPGTGNRVTIVAYDAAVTTGTVTAAVTGSMTASVANYGELGFVRVRASAGGSITAAFDATDNRIGVTLGGFLTDGPTTIYRVAADGTQTEVRGGTVNVSGGAGFVWDYEYRTNESVYYVALDSATQRVSNTVTVTDSRAWLRAPGLPGLDTVVRFRAVPDRALARPTTYLAPIGRTTTIPVADVRKAPTFTLEAVCVSEAESLALENLLVGAGTAFVVWPGTRHHGTYVSIADASVHSVAGKVGTTDYVWTLACTEVARPAGGIEFDPTASWQAIKNTSASWTAVKTTYTNWLDVLQGPNG